MGGIPEYAFLSMALPVETGTGWIDKFLDGLHDLAIREYVVLAGGDTTKSPRNIAIAITVIGIIKKRLKNLITGLTILKNRVLQQLNADLNN